MKRIFSLILFVLIVNSCISKEDKKTEVLDITPYPQHVTINSNSKIALPYYHYKADMPLEALQDLEQYLKEYPLPLKNVSDSDSLKANIHLNITDHKKFPNNESYELFITKHGEIIINAPEYSGIFYGLQTVAQLAAEDSLPMVSIRDYPRFKWRGMHLDVSRHFYDIKFIKKQLDALSHYKINYFHWHLTDGAGWRIEIPAYPRLTEIAAWRGESDWKEWWFGAPDSVSGEVKNNRRYRSQGSPGAYGGYYTAEDVREVLEYARLRNITIVPEIEMPGHSEEVLVAYPELSCSGEPYKNSDFCVGNEETFTFLENVLSYIIELFPSEYIHIGGDEAGKGAWKLCDKCQERMKSEGLKDVDELQSYLIHRIEKFINSKGRKLLGWDEILQGGLAPNATVMSWRGTEGGIAAAKSGHDVVMTPGGYCYLDAYQADPETQPEAIGGFLPLEKVYSFDPVPSAKIRKHILGVQGNVWTEYMPTYSHTEYMIYPRILAIAEVGWTKTKNKSWDSFKKRVNHEVTALHEKGYNAFPLNDRPLSSQEVFKDHIMLSLHSERVPIEIRYTTDGSEPTLNSPLYTNSIRVKDSLFIKAALFYKDSPIGESVSINVDFHKGIGKKATYLTRIYPDYAAGGEKALVDGLLGGKGYGDGRWQGFCPNEMEVVIDLGRLQKIHRVKANFMQMIGPGIFFPSKVEVYGSENGIDFTLLGEQLCSVPVDFQGALFQIFGWEGDKTELRYVKFAARQNGKGGFVFTDEIIIQ